MAVLKKVFGSGIVEAATAAASATPVQRDRVVDLLRGGSLLVVVIGHVLMALVVWPEETPEIRNLLAEFPAAQILTWVLQVMPLFFAAGAIANRTSWLAATDANVAYSEWVWQRMRRLMRPVLYYLAAWIPLVIILEMVLGADAAPLASLSTQLLWFLAVYVLVVAATPALVRAATRGWYWPTVALVVCAVVDLGRFHVHSAVAIINFVLVWLATAVLGLVVRDRISKPGPLLAVAVAVLVGNAALVIFGPYPLSMVGLPGEPISNMAPPTFVLALHAVTLVCLVGAAWTQLARICNRKRVWITVNVIGGVAMTLYLWHLTALIGFTLAMYALGVHRPDIDSTWFWPVTVLWAGTASVIIWVLTAALAPLEYRPVPWWEKPKSTLGPNPALAIFGVVCTGVGLLALAATGMYGFPNAEVTRYLGIPLTPAVGMALFVLGLLASRLAAEPAHKVVQKRK